MAKHFDLQLFHGFTQIFHYRIQHYFRIVTTLLLIGYPLKVAAQLRVGNESEPIYRSVEDLLAAGFTENPSVLAARARWEAASTEIPAKRALPDPNIGYVHYIESVETRVGPQQGALNISQRLPGLGKLRLEGRIAELRADIRYFQYLATTQMIAARIEDAYWDYYYLLQALEITEQNLELMRNWEQVALSKYTTARAGHPDIIKAQVEVLNLEDRLISLRQRQKPLLERLSASTGSRLTAASLTVVEPRVAESAPEIDSMITELVQRNPDLLGSGVAVELEKITIRRAQLNYMPDFTIGGSRVFTGTTQILAANDPDNGKDPLMITFGLSLPVYFKKNSSLVQSARIGQRSAELATQDLENHLRSQLELILFELEDATRKVRLYEEALIPRAEQSLLTSEKAYIGDAVDFLTLIEAQRVLLNYQLSYRKALAEQASQRAQLRALLGRYSINTSSNEEK